MCRDQSDQRGASHTCEGCNEREPRWHVSGSDGQGKRHVSTLIAARCEDTRSGAPPNFVGAGLALVLSSSPSPGALFAVGGVFLAKNHTTDDLSKAVTQLQGAALTIVGYFATADPGTVEKIAVVTGAVVSVIGVWWARNEGRAAIKETVLPGTPTTALPPETAV